MRDVLDRIVDSKRREVAERSQSRSVDDLKKVIADLERPRNFFAAVTRQPVKLVNVIAEVKKASPSAGVIREDFDPVAIATAFAEAGADAISCLTDEPFFQGKLEYIAQIKQAIGLPVLRKDFIIDPWQVYEARAAGADAILLIAECLPSNTLIDLQILATELHMTTLIEVHSIDNFMRVRDGVIGVPHKSYSLLGINNRDLQTFKVDLATTLRMVEMVEDKKVLVSESGIHSREQVQRLADAGVRSVLVGETLMRSDNLPNAMWQIFGK